MTKTYLGLGSNKGNREKTLHQTLDQISKRIGTITSHSSLYQTQPWGITEQPDFLNLVIEVNTSLNAIELLGLVLEIEKIMGRTRHRKWYSRIIDIDVLFYGDQIIREKDLVVPHPYITQRNFVMVPLVEIAADLIHPVLKKTIKELYTDLFVPLPVRRISPQIPFQTIN